MTRRIQSVLLGLLISTASAMAADVKYKNDFQNAPVDSLPDELMVLDGQFTVKEENGNKFIELPGAPLDAFGFLFGPSAKEDIAASARIFATSSGRKYSAFEIGVYGVGGYKLRVTPAKRALELYRSDVLKHTVPLKWQSGKWTHLKLQVVKTGESKWKVAGKCWEEGAQEPAEPALVFEDTEAPASGRASVGGMPYSGTPIRFDDLEVGPPAK